MGHVKNGEGGKKGEREEEISVMNISSFTVEADWAPWVAYSGWLAGRQGQANLSTTSSSPAVD